MAINSFRRFLRSPGKYIQAVARWKRVSFDQAPPVFGNSKPKSGSHLLLQILAGLTRIVPTRYVAAEPIRTITKDGERRSVHAILEDLRNIPAGVIGWGYVEATPENVAFLCRPERVNYFIYRDPRDMLIPYVIPPLYRLLERKWDTKAVNSVLIILTVAMYLASALIMTGPLFPLLVLVAGLTMASPFWIFLIFLRASVWLYKREYDTKLTIPLGLGSLAWLTTYIVTWR